MEHPVERPVISTKLKPPKLGEMVARPLLVEKALQRDCQVLLVLAPAGYGKTTFLTQLARSSPRPTAWYSLEPQDNDLPTFFTHLAAALKPHASVDQRELERLLAQLGSEGLARWAASLFIRALEARPQGVLLILDNWQAITHPFIYEMLRELIPLLPQETTLVLGGRNPLGLVVQLGLERLHLAGQVQLLDRGDLQFNQEELAAFAALRCPTLDQEQFSRAAQLSGGWPICLNFLTQLDAVWGEALDQIPPALAAYLDREIWAAVPQDLFSCLIKVSVLPSFTSSDWAQLLGCPQPEKGIGYLQDHQLFLEKTGDQYSLVPIIRAHLHAKLGDERSATFKKAGAVALSKGQIHQAINCFLEAGERRGLTDLLIQFGGEAVQHGRWQELSHWFDQAVSVEEIKEDPRLSLLQALAAMDRGQLGQAHRAVRQAEALFERAGDKLGLAECQLLKARIYRGWGAMEESFRFLFDAEANLSASRFSLLLALEKATLYYTSGRLREARELLLKCQEGAEEAGDREALVRILEALGNVTYLLGEPARAILLFKRALDLSPEGVMPGYGFQDVLSAIYDDWGETEQALVVAEREAALRQKRGLTELLPSSWLQLACVYTNLGRYEEAERHFLQGIAYVREHDGDHQSLVLNLAFLARALAIQGKWVAARSYAQEALQAAETQPALTNTAVATIAGGILARTGSWAEGLELLQRAEIRSEQMGFLKSLAYCCQSLASLHFLQGDLPQARTYTRKALKVSAKINDLQNFVTCYHWYYPLLMHGLEMGIEISFVQRVLRKVGPATLKHLLPLLNTGDPETKQRIIPILLEIGGAEVGSALETLQNDPSAYVRNTAAEASERLRSGERELHVLQAQPVLRVYLLGPVRIFAGEQEITAVKWRSQRARDLLIYLIHAGQPVTKDQIIEALWPEDCLDLAKADARFHTTLYRLRSVLKQFGFADLIKHGTDVYTLSGPVTTDRAQFEALVKGALDLEENSAGQMKLLERAFQHYHGDYLEYLDYEWPVPHREALRLRSCAAQLRLANCYLTAKQFEKAINHLLSLISRDELNETYHSLLMTAYAQSGQWQLAQRQYAQLAEILETELGVSPSPETQLLYEKLNLGVH